MKTSLPVVILAGGLATRLRPITETIPKSLVEVNGEPFVIHQLRLLKDAGIDSVVMCIGYLGEMIEDFVGNGNKFGLSVTYSFDGPSLLGTAGAIKKALPLLDNHFFVLYGDSYLPCNYVDIATMFLNAQKKGLMTVFKNQGQWDKSNVEFSENKIKIYDKNKQTPNMHHIDYGLGLLTKNAFDSIAPNVDYDLATLYQNLLTENELAAYEVFERFYEVGSFAGINELGYYLQHCKKHEICRVD